jgi:hypothetical protein
LRTIQKILTKIVVECFGTKGIIPLSLHSQIEKKGSSFKKNHKYFLEKIKINLVGIQKALTFALQLKNRYSKISKVL